jgi:ADP-ribose pyrophosphatase YjhB (NUDIX family)
VLLVDERARILLFRGFDPAKRDLRFWFPPGGGIQAGEAARDAATREILEETGLDGLELGPHVWNRRHVLWFNGAHLDVREVWFFARVSAFEVDTAGFTADERRFLPEHRWWTQAELRATTDVLTPRDLPALLAELLQRGLPGHPKRVGV